MSSLPQNKLDPRIQNVWRCNDAFWIIILTAICAAVCKMVTLEPQARAIGEAGFTLVLVLGVIALVIWLFVLPPIRFIRWRYEITPEYLDIARGIIWRKRVVIPFIRVQNTDTRQGPLLRLFGLASVTVSTAAGEHEIPGLSFTAAEELRNRAAELARLAREDV